MFDIGFEDTRDDEGYGEDDTDERTRSGDQLGVIPVIAQYTGVLVSVLLATAFHLQLRIRQCK
ncbi:hypothetical protein ACNQT2_01190 [Corynebacterium diphtheriae]